MAWEIRGPHGCWVSSECLCHTALWTVSSICLHVTYEKPELQGDEILPDTSRVHGADLVKLWSGVLAPEPLLPSTVFPLNYNPTWQPCITPTGLRSQPKLEFFVVCVELAPGAWVACLDLQTLGSHPQGQQETLLAAEGGVLILL